MAFLSLGVALFSLRYAAIPWNIWLAVGTEIHALGLKLPMPLLVHVMGGATALATGPFQFLSGLRAAHPLVHRVSGRLYASACIVAGAAALVLAANATGGPIAGLGFAMLGTSWIATTVAAWRAAMRGDYARHRMLMRFSFALTFAAVTLRLEVPLGFAFFGFKTYVEMSRWLAYTCWIPNVLVVGLYTVVTGVRRNAVPRPA